MATAAGQLLFDESGQPFILIREQERQKRLTGVEALKVFLNFYFSLNLPKFLRVTFWQLNKSQIR